MKKLTKRQREALTYVIQSIRYKGMPPTLRELSDRLGIVHHYATRCLLDALNEKGYITYVRTRARGIRVNWETTKPLGLPYPEWKTPPAQEKEFLTR